MSTFVPKTNVPTRNRASSRVSSHEKEKNRRVLWILNHTTLLEWEVPMLRELGFEVYVPKKLPVGPNSRTATVTDAHDRSLSIPSADLEHLNTVNFYDSPLDAQTARIINRHFGNCISASIYPGLYYILKAFTGRIFMRAFGHAGAIDYEEATATIPKDSLESGSFFHFRQEARKLFHSVLNRRRVAARVAFRNTVMMEMYACRHRIYLAAAYREIIDNERAFLKARSLYLPLALPPSIMRTRHSWNPEDNRVLFICPNIDQIDYYRRIYLQFKEELGHFPYCIAGRQDLNGVNVPLTTRDPNILGHVERRELDKLMRTCSCMFYHSQEPRHLHYHPLEAIVTGMPLVFMAGGLLETLGGSDQPGKCTTYEEARNKISRLQRGDVGLQKSICSQQQRILESFMPDYCARVWRETFRPIAMGDQE